MQTYTKQYFTCSLCGRTSTDERKIAECEAGHVQLALDTPIEVEYNKRNPYPDRITVALSDGSVGVYDLVKRREKDDC